MTLAEAYDKAWRLGRKGDFSLVDEIYHQNYKSIDYRTGIETNIEDDKVIVSTLGESVVFGPSKALFEGEDFVCVEGFAKRQFNVNDPSYGIMMTALSYQDGKIVSQKTVSSDLDFDPSEEKDWNWEDYERSIDNKLVGHAFNEIKSRTAV